MYNEMDQEEFKEIQNFVTFLDCLKDDKLAWRSMYYLTKLLEDRANIINENYEVHRRNCDKIKELQDKNDELNEDLKRALKAKGN